ncbi:CdiA family toxin C-terminal domain-containing protein [Paenibacillus thiaminolyticus]|uniref:CdiA family toxin C-terminal domain-containing protein n=1 Tax=Paenibacillus thiaminolyticus TaxID=49283 RepID=UPI002543E0A2|nr:CdiA family toxin C-terminal domain-containing protein [Paenibacillus thiaminolyticus]WII36484.1 CdiA family toxin C-terminal domain-containing protein [Paenibacillus thiaminolyticus]
MIIVNMEKLSDLKNGNAYTNPKFLGMDQERLDQLGTALMVVNLSMLAKHGLYKAADKLANSKTMSAMGDSWAAWKKQVEHELGTARMKPLKGKGEASLRTEEMGKPELKPAPKPAPKPGIEGMGNGGGGSSQLWKQGTPLREINYTISTDAKRHLIATNDPISGKKGVNGTHNSDEFYNSLKSTGKDIENMISPEDITYDIDFPGLATIKYKIPKSDGKGTYFDEYKYIGNPKTVYNPRVYGDEQMYQWGLEAMKNGYLNGYLICGEASNGM